MIVYATSAAFAIILLNGCATHSVHADSNHPGVQCENRGGTWKWNGSINQWQCINSSQRSQQQVNDNSQNIQTFTNGINQLTNQLNNMTNQMNQRNNSYQGFDASKGLNFRGYGY